LVRWDCYSPSSAQVAVGGLTVLDAGAKKYAGTNGGQSKSARTRQCKGTCTTEHRRLRNSRDGGGHRDILAYLGIKTGSFPLKGFSHSAGPFLLQSVLTEPLRAPYMPSTNRCAMLGPEY